MKRFLKYSSNSGTWNELLGNSHNTLKTWQILELTKCDCWMATKGNYCFIVQRIRNGWGVFANSLRKQTARDVSNHEVIQMNLLNWCRRLFGGSYICGIKVIQDELNALLKSPKNKYSYAWSRIITGKQAPERTVVKNNKTLSGMDYTLYYG